MATIESRTVRMQPPPQCPTCGSGNVLDACGPCAACEEDRAMGRPPVCPCGICGFPEDEHQGLMADLDERIGPDGLVTVVGPCLTYRPDTTKEARC